jgi:hypothetical protein
VATITDSGIEVYAADSAGQQTLVASLPEFRVGPQALEKRFVCIAALLH